MWVKIMAGPTTEHLSDQIDKVREQVFELVKEVGASRRDAVDGQRQLGDTFAIHLREIREHVGEELAKLRQEVGGAREATVSIHADLREDIARVQIRTDAVLERVDRSSEDMRALIAGQGAAREDIARTQARTDAILERVDRTSDDVRSLITGQAVSREDIARNQARTDAILQRIDRSSDDMRTIRNAMIGVCVTILAGSVSVIWGASRLSHTVEDHGRRLEKVEGQVSDRVDLKRAIEKVQQPPDSRPTAPTK